MKWRIVFARTAEKELAKLSSEIGQRIGRAIRALEQRRAKTSSQWSASSSACHAVALREGG
jgi:mRNA-degrading endonuclease RelE of RelBE toxin-antitoxin system